MSIFSFLFGKKTQNNTNIKVLNPLDFKNKITGKKVQLVDVRTPKEFKQGAIKKAINIDFFSGTFNVKFDKLNKEEALYIYCRSGGRSRQTSKKLAKRGFTEIYDLKGGFLNW